MPSAGLVRGRAVRRQEDDVVGALVDEHGAAVGRGRRDGGALAGDDRLGLVGRGERDEPARGSSFHTFIDARSTTRTPPSTAWTAMSSPPSCMPAGLVDPPDAGVDDAHRALRPVVHGDDVRCLVDVVVAAGLGDADRRRDLADDPVDVADEAPVALEQPRPAVVGLGLGALAPLGLQGSDDDGPDDEAEHDEDAAGDAAARALGHASHSTSSVTAAPPCRGFGAPPSTVAEVGARQTRQRRARCPVRRRHPCLMTLGCESALGYQRPATIATGTGPLARTATPSCALRSPPQPPCHETPIPPCRPSRSTASTSSSPIGRGGFSYVFSARQRDFNRRVALKVLAFGLADERERRSFERECRAMGLVSQHPHIVTVFNAAFTTSKQPCIVMELYSGGTLGERLKQEGPLPLPLVLDVGVKIAGALQTAHDRGLLHRDIKPQNLFVSEFGEPALGDFGISTLDDERSISHGGGLTVHYAPPEVLEGAPATTRSDVYSFAATLYTLLEGARPFAAAGGAKQSVGDLARRIMLEEPPRVRRPDVPRLAERPARRGDGQATRRPAGVGGRARRGPATGPGRARAGGHRRCRWRRRSPRRARADGGRAGPAALGRDRPGGLPPPTRSRATPSRWPARRRRPLSNPNRHPPPERATGGSCSGRSPGSSASCSSPAPCCCSDGRRRRRRPGQHGARPRRSCCRSIRRRRRACRWCPAPIPPGPGHVGRRRRRGRRVPGPAADRRGASRATRWSWR